jgi:capsular polysaccharide biosynthesis protein/Mrp family chromosome partitioning ATPase
MAERIGSSALSGWQRLIDLPGDEGLLSDESLPSDEGSLVVEDVQRPESSFDVGERSLTVEDVQERPEVSFEVGDGFGSRTGDRVLGARYAAAFREHWIYVVLTVALAVAGAAAYVQLAEERYEATAEVSVATVPADALRGLPVLPESIPGRNVVEAALLTKSPQVTSRVRDDLRLALSPSAVGDLVRATPRQESDVLSITGIGGSPEAAATIANAFADALLAERTRRFQKQLRQVIERSSRRLNAIANRAESAEAASLSTRLADYRALSDRPDPTLEVVRAAVPPSSPAWPRPLITILVAVVIGLLVGGVVAMALELANPIVMRTEALAEPDGPPMLARMPRLTNRETRQLLVDPGTASPHVREEVRGLSEVVSDLLPNWSSPRNWSAPKSLLVTSAGPGDGSPSVAATLAGSIAQSGMSVALIDVDLERGPIATIIDGGMRPAPSIGQILTARDAPALLDRIEPISPSRRLEVLVARDDGHLAGRLPPDRLSTLVEHLRSRFQALVISAPPLPSTDAVALLGSADAVILVVALGRTRRDELTKLREVSAMRDVASLGYVALERRTLLARLSRTASHLKPSARRRWARRAHRLS